jgi:hypothetical protein
MLTQRRAVPEREALEQLEEESFELFRTIDKIQERKADLEDGVPYDYEKD